MKAKVLACPFPGMDPYLESQHYWLDFHNTFMTYWRDALVERLPDHYEARVEEQICLLELTEEDIKDRYPDIIIAKRRPPVGPARGKTTALRTKAKRAKLMLHPAYERVREIRIQILHHPDRNVVAFLELLSPTNKNGDGFHQYRAKRNEVFCDKRVHLVELDFLVGGNRLPMRKPLPLGDYYAFVSRGNQRPWAEVYSWSVRQALPTVSIPLVDPDPDIPVDLGAVFAQTYERGRYANWLNYEAPLTVPLRPDDLEWAKRTARPPKKSG